MRGGIDFPFGLSDQVGAFRCDCPLAFQQFADIVANESLACSL